MDRMFEATSMSGYGHPLRVSVFVGVVEYLDDDVIVESNALPQSISSSASADSSGRCCCKCGWYLCKALTIPEHYLDVSHEKLFSGQLPTRIMIGLVSNSALNGHLTANPLNLRHLDLSQIALSVVSREVLFLVTCVCL